MSWLNKYPGKNSSQFVEKNYSFLIKLGFLVLLIGLLYVAFQYVLTYISTKVSPMVVNATSAAGTGLAATALVTKFLPFLLAFKVILKIIKTILTFILVTGVLLLYLNVKHPEIFETLIKNF